MPKNWWAMRWCSTRALGGPWGWGGKWVGSVACRAGLVGRASLLLSPPPPPKYSWAMHVGACVGGWTCGTLLAFVRLVGGFLHVAGKALRCCYLPLEHHTNLSGADLLLDECGSGQLGLAHNNAYKDCGAAADWWVWQLLRRHGAVAR